MKKSGIRKAMRSMKDRADKWKIIVFQCCGDVVQRLIIPIRQNRVIVYDPRRL